MAPQPNQRFPQSCSLRLLFDSQGVMKNQLIIMYERTRRGITIQVGQAAYFHTSFTRKWKRVLGQRERGGICYGDLNSRMCAQDNCRGSDKERSSYSQFPKPHWESWSGEDLATSAVGVPTSRCGSGNAIANPCRKPIFGVVGLMYKR